MLKLRYVFAALIFCLPAYGDDDVEPSAEPPEISIEEETPASKEVTDTTPAAGFQATHKQSAVIAPIHNGVAARLSSFALDNDGNIVAGVTRYVQTYSPDGELLHETWLPFTPTAVTVTPEGIVLVAGTGKIARVSEAGKLLGTADSPHVGDLETLTARLEEEAKKQKQEVAQRYIDMIQIVETRISAIEEIAEEDRTSREKSMLRSLPQQLSSFKRRSERLQEKSTAYTPKSLLKRRMGITAIAATEKDVFLTCYAIKGRGYEVWRMDHELSSPKRILTGLRGCCGQCDVQAAGENLVIGENTKFQVALVNREGERLADFGKKDRSSVDGFGGCCNPMNVHCCRNGDIITSESSVGNIKRYSQSGEYLGLIGKASISGGCKHVAVSYDETRDRFYTMNIDKGHICVLLPLSEAPEYTPEELAAKAAMDVHGSRLLGHWELKLQEDSEIAKRDSTEKRAVRSVSLPQRTSTYVADSYTFNADGTLDIKGGMFQAYTNSWKALSHTDSSITLAHYQDGVYYYEFVVSFGDEDKAEIELKRGGSRNAMSSNEYKRTSCGESCEETKSASGQRLSEEKTTE